MKVIDLSSYQTVNSFVAVKNSGVQGVILRTILKNNSVDACFEKFYKGFTAIGLPVGGYVYSYDLSYNEAVERANKVKNLFKDKDITFVALDLEWGKQRAKGRTLIGQVIQAYIDVFKGTGIEVIGYWNLDWHKNIIPSTYKDKMRYWIARYPMLDTGTRKDSLKPNVGESMWQYSSKGNVSGIKGYVDMNECYVANLWNRADKGLVTDKGIDYSAVFDAQYYAAKYPDLQPICGANVDKLLLHFVNYGMKERRQAIATFNPVVYHDKYLDLQKAFVHDWTAYYLHYIQHGKAEGRKSY